MTEKVIELTFCWKDKFDRTGRFVERIPALQQALLYQPFHPWREQLWPSARQARCEAFNARSLVAFTDATDLRHSNARKRVLGGIIERPGFDHSRLWKERGAGRILITAEPYWDKLDEAVAYCADVARWACHVMPQGIGMWNSAPPRGTRMLLISPGKRGVQLEAMIAVLDGVMPAADEDYREGFPENAFDPDE
jgi:hypothetical protein